MSMADYFMAKNKALQANQGAMAPEVQLESLSGSGVLSLHDELDKGPVLFMKKGL